MPRRHKKNKYQLAFALPETDLPKKGRRRKKLSWKPWLWGGFFILLLAGAVYLFVFSPVFKIEEIKISGNNLISTEQIQAVAENVLEQKILKIIPRDTVLVLVDNKIGQEIFNNFPEIASVEVKMAQIDELDILVSERKTAAIVCQIIAVLVPSPTPSPPSMTPSVSPLPTQAQEKLPESEECFFVDEGGVAYREAPKISGTILPTFYRQNMELRRRTEVIQPSTIQFAAQLKKELRESNVDLTGFVLEDEISQELKAFTGEGWLIYFDMNRSAFTQAKVLEALLKEEIKDKRATLQYVDLRVANRVYYK